MNIAYFHFFSAGQPYCSVKFVSLRTGDEIHSINYKTLTVQNVECNKRYCIIYYMGLDAKKPVFGVSDKVRFKPACSATETS